MSVFHIHFACFCALFRSFFCNSICWLFRCPIAGGKYLISLFCFLESIFFRACICSSAFSFMNVGHKIKCRQILLCKKFSMWKSPKTRQKSIQKKKQNNNTQNGRRVPQTCKLYGHSFPGYFSSIHYKATCFCNLCSMFYPWSFLWPATHYRFSLLHFFRFKWCFTWCKIASLVPLYWLKNFHLDFPQKIPKSTAKQSREKRAYLWYK